MGSESNSEKLKLCTSALALALASFVTATAGQCEERSENVTERLTKASQRILEGSGYDAKAVSKSLYSQIRPKVKISKAGLTDSTIDKKTWSYVSQKYLPALILSYRSVYKEMKDAGLGFSACSNPVSFGNSVKKALCIDSPVSKGIPVRYLTRMSSDEKWSETARFIFEVKDAAAELVSIKLPLKENQQVFIEGL